MNHSPKCKTKTIKLLEKKIEDIYDLGLYKDFIDTTPRAQSTHDQFEFINI